MAKLRSEIDDKFKWAVNDIFATDEAWNDEYERCKGILDTPSRYEGIIGESASNLASELKEEMDESFACERLYVYAFMKYYEDTANPVYQAMSGKAQMLAMSLSEKYAYSEPKILAIDKNKMDEYLATPEIEPYRHLLEDMLSKREHSLSAAEEKLLAMSDQMSQAASEIFSKFNNADVRFGDIHDENGESVELTHGTFGVYMESNNREVRKEAFYALYKQYKEHINTLASTYYANVCQAMFYARARKYPSVSVIYTRERIH